MDEIKVARMVEMMVALWAGEMVALMVEMMVALWAGEMVAQKVVSRADLKVEKMAVCMVALTDESSVVC